eukprot:scaffold1254_cov251-Pinguiococcus_pyrenoidosus.AAC.18
MEPESRRRGSLFACDFSKPSIGWSRQVEVAGSWVRTLEMVDHATLYLMLQYPVFEGSVFSRQPRDPRGWSFGALELWSFGALELWSFGALKLWSCRDFGT